MSDRRKPRGCLRRVSNGRIECLRIRHARALESAARRTLTRSAQAAPAPRVQQDEEEDEEHEESEREDSEDEQSLYVYTDWRMEAAAEAAEAGDEEWKMERGLTQTEIERLPTYVSSDRRGDVCLICQVEIRVEEGRRLLPCIHSFHVRCIDEWLGRKPTCPTCRIEIRPRL